MPPSVRWDELRLRRHRGPLRRPAGAGPGRRGGHRAGADDRRAPAARGVRAPPDARPVPLGAPGRGAARVHPHAARCWPTSWASIRRRSCSALQTGDPRPRPVAGRPVGRGRGRRLATGAADADRTATGPALALPAPTARAAAPTLVGRRRRGRRRRGGVDDRARDRSSRASRWSSARPAPARRASPPTSRPTIHGTGATVLWGRAAQEALVPFEALVQALRTALLRDVAAGPRAGHRRPRRAGRAAARAAAARARRCAPSCPAADVERYLLFETVAEMLASESAVRPILLVIDDVQWADGGTIKLLEHVLRHERGGRVLVLATQRDPSEDPHPELDRLLMALARDDELLRVAVGALDADAVGELLRLAGQSEAAAAEPALGDGRQRLLPHRADHERRRPERGGAARLRAQHARGPRSIACRRRAPSCSPWPPSPGRCPRCRCWWRPASSTPTSPSTPPTSSSPPACSARTAPDAW